MQKGKEEEEENIVHRMLHKIISSFIFNEQLTLV